MRRWRQRQSQIFGAQQGERSKSRGSGAGGIMVTTLTEPAWIGKTKATAPRQLWLGSIVPTRIQRFARRDQPVRQTSRFLRTDLMYV